MIAFNVQMYGNAGTANMTPGGGRFDSTRLLAVEV